MKDCYTYSASLPSKNGNRPLTKREIEVFELSYLPEKIIAGYLFISRETVKNHMQSIRKKTGAYNKAEMWGFYQSSKEQKGYIN